MMNNEHMKTVLDVFASVLEQVAFMFADPPEEAQPQLGDGGIVQVTMSFNGPFKGVMDLTVPRGMCEILAANVLGLEPDDELVTRAPFDTLKELLNITCGNVLTTIAGDEPVFDLTIPEVQERTSDDWQPLAERPATVYCMADDFPVLLHMETGE